MSSHADAIRAALALPSGHNYASAIARREMQNEARVALDALLAENKRYEKALERIAPLPTRTESIVAAPHIAREALAGGAE